MTLFQNFPQTFFTLTRQQKKIVTDIFRRVIFQVPDNTSVLLPYIILDGETPELVADKLYGNPLYHWALLLVNNIISVRDEWPIENKYVTRVVYDKYPFTVFCSSTTAFTEDTIVTSSDGGKFIIEAVAPDHLVMRSLRGKTYLTTSSQLSIGGNVVPTTITTVLDPEESTHHYIDTRYQLQVDFSSSNPFIEPVSNIDHEIAINEQKRLIRVIDPNQIGRVTTDLQRAYLE